jgi:peroxidase
MSYGAKCYTGAQTIGRASYGSIQQRVFNYSGTGKPDPSIDGKYLNFLKRKCKWASNLVDLDERFSVWRSDFWRVT